MKIGFVKIHHRLESYVKQNECTLLSLSLSLSPIFTQCSLSLVTRSAACIKEGKLLSESILEASTLTQGYTELAMLGTKICPFFVSHSQS
jgi:hypothetical protein